MVFAATPSGPMPPVKTCARRTSSQSSGQYASAATNRSSRGSPSIQTPESRGSPPASPRCTSGGLHGVAASPRRRSRRARAGRSARSASHRFYAAGGHRVPGGELRRLAPLPRYARKGAIDLRIARLAERPARRRLARAAQPARPQRRRLDRRVARAAPSCTAASTPSASRAHQRRSLDGCGHGRRPGRSAEPRLRCGGMGAATGGRGGDPRDRATRHRPQAADRNPRAPQHDAQARRDHDGARDPDHPPVRTIIDLAAHSRAVRSSRRWTSRSSAT